MPLSEEMFFLLQNKHLTKTEDVIGQKKRKKKDLTTLQAQSLEFSYPNKIYSVNDPKL